MFAVHQVAVLLLAIALVLPRACMADMVGAPAGDHSHQSGVVDAMAAMPGMDHANCGAHGGGQTQDHGQQHCCDLCTCCAAPAITVPQLAPFKAKVIAVSAPVLVIGIRERASLAWQILPINSHGPPSPTSMT